MLGSALISLLQSLAEIPADKRTKEQQALFEELALMYAASKIPRPDIQHEQQIALHSQLRSQLKIEDLASFSIVRPKPKTTRNCSLCGQPLKA